MSASILSKFSCARFWAGDSCTTGQWAEITPGLDRGNSEPSVCMAMMWPCTGWGGRGLWRMVVGTMFMMACMASSSRSRAAVLSVVDVDIPDEMALAVVVPMISPLASLMGWSAVIISCAELARWWPRLERLAVTLDARVVRLYILPNIFEESIRTAEPWLFRDNPLNA